MIFQYLMECSLKWLIDWLIVESDLWERLMCYISDYTPTWYYNFKHPLQFLLDHLYCSVNFIYKM
jgi:hypothetical protein